MGSSQTTESVQTSQVSRSTTVSVAVVLCVGIGLSFWAYNLANSWQQERQQVSFVSSAKDRVTGLKLTLAHWMEELDSIAAFYESSEYVTREEFHHFVNHILAHNELSEAFEWAPKIDHQQRHEFELQMQSKGFPDFKITEQDDKGNLIRAGDRLQYYPIQYLEPYKENSTALGFDIGSEAIRLEAIKRAEQNRYLTVTPQIHLLQDKLNRVAVLSLRPVFSDYLTDHMGKDLKGFIVGVQYAGELLESSLSELTPAGIDLHLYDQSAASELLAFHSSRKRQKSAEAVVDRQTLLNSQLHYIEKIDVADRSWEVISSAAPVFYEQRKNWMPVTILLVGIISTSLFALLLFMSSSNAERQRRLAEEAIRSKKALQESRNRLSEAQKLAHVGHWDWQVTENKLHWSDEIYRIFGLEPQQFGASYEAFLATVHPDDRDMVNQANAAAMENETPYSIDHRIVLPDGRTRLVHEEAEVIFEGGKPVRMMGTVQDVTERNKAEEKYSQLFHSSVDAILIHDLDGHILDANTKALELFGYSISEIKTVLIPELHPLEALEASKDAFKQFENDSFLHVEIDFRKKNGEIFSGDVTASLVQLDEVDLVQAIVRDVTEKKSLAEQLRQAQKMESIGTLVGGIAHDFNNTLAAIQGNIYLAKQAAHDNALAIEKLTSVERLGTRAAEMIKQLLTFARKDTVRINSFSMNILVNETIDLVRKGVPENIEISCRMCNQNLIVGGDVAQLQQAILNLVNNAYDAVADAQEPEIMCELSVCAVTSQIRRKYPDLEAKSLACLSIKDNGSGIEKKNLEAIFEPFFTTKEVGKGTGLGLSMVYGAIQNHGGVIEVYSKPIQGSEFRVYLPIQAGDKTDSKIDDQHAVVIKGRGETILLVDDEQEVRETSRDVLIKLGYRVLEACNGEEEISVFRANQGSVDLILSDVVMPTMSGVAAAKAIRQIDETILPIIFVTGYSKEKIITAEERMERSIVISKPFSIGKLSQSLRSMLES